MFGVPSPTLSLQTCTYIVNALHWLNPRAKMRITTHRTKRLSDSPGIHHSSQPEGRFSQKFREDFPGGSDSGIVSQEVSLRDDSEIQPREHACSRLNFHLSGSPLRLDFQVRTVPDADFLGNHAWVDIWGNFSGGSTSFVSEVTLQQNLGCSVRLPENIEPKLQQQKICAKFVQVRGTLTLPHLSTKPTDQTNAHAWIRIKTGVEPILTLGLQQAWGRAAHLQCALRPHSMYECSVV